jgi:salicylate hydroxylase
MANTPRILIAGAGIGGLTAALALLKQGFDVEVYEQAGELKEVGAGLQLSANATRVLHLLGVGEAVRSVACEPAGKEIKLWNTGQTWKLFDLGAESVKRYGAPYFMLYRPDLHNVLVEAVRREKPSAIHLNSKCIGVTQRNGQVELELQNGSTAVGDALIGADGVHSKVREELFGADKARFTGIIAWRGVVPMERLPARLRRLVGLNWIGPGSHVINYPLRRGELFNFAGYVEGSHWQVESWSERGSLEECAADFQGWHDDIQTVIGHLEQPYKWAVMTREPMAQWTVGHISLLGDACHPTVPFLAQGAAMAIEDAFVLARCFEKYAPDVGAALRQYERARIERTTKIVQGSSEMTKRFHNKLLADPAEAENYVSREWTQERIEARYNWLFSYDVTQAAI